MDEKNINKNEEVELDLGRIFQAVVNRAWFVALVSVVLAVVVCLGTVFFVTPEYKSSAMFYVNNSNFSLKDASVSMSSGDLVTSRNLVDSYIVILNTRETLVDVVDYAGVSRSYQSVRGMISSEAVNETEIFRVTVTSTDPYEAEALADAIAYVLPKRIGTIIDGTSAKVVDAAVVPTSPSSPSYSKNTVLGFVMGLVLSVGVIALREIFDITIRSEQDVTQACKYPILAAVPNMTASSKGGSYYKSGSYYSGSRDGKKNKQANLKKNLQAGVKKNTDAPVLIGDDIGFVASEAYKLLRTKLQFSFADDSGCRVICLSSALSGEGKSLTSVNLAHTLSQLNKKVILIDCDMRRPTLAEKLGIMKTPGLSSYLTAQSNLETLIQKPNLKGSGDNFYVISAGQNPPNPIELLSSARMKHMLDALRKDFDYVVLDMPPITEVSDALAVANNTDGVLLVVRENYCDRIALAETVRQFEFINAKILGTVFNCTDEHTGNYGKRYYKHYYKRYYKRYYHRYGSRYGTSYYENNDRTVAEPKRNLDNE